MTSYNNLRKEALEIERWNFLHPAEEQKISYIAECLGEEKGVFVAVSDFMKALPDGLSKWIPGRLITLGTDGFGRSDTREELRRFFEIDAAHIAYAAIVGLYKEGKIDDGTLKQAGKDLSIEPDKPNPMKS